MRKLKNKINELSFKVARKYNELSELQLKVINNTDTESDRNEMEVLRKELIRLNNERIDNIKNLRAFGVEY